MYRTLELSSIKQTRRELAILWDTIDGVSDTKLKEQTQSISKAISILSLVEEQLQEALMIKELA